MRDDKSPWWYRQALDAASETGSVVVLGARIHYETWGREGPGIVLIHGSNGHLEWWRFVAPFLADRFRVAAFDLSGNGDSSWRERYTAEVFAEEAWQATASAASSPSRPRTATGTNSPGRCSSTSRWQARRRAWSGGHGRKPGARRRGARASIGTSRPLALALAIKGILLAWVAEDGRDEMNDALARV